MTTDQERARLEPLLPRNPRQGRRWRDRRLVISGIFFRNRAGCPWRDLPGHFGNCKTICDRHRRWPGRDYAWRGTAGVASIRIWLRHPVP